jgi:hypothetical protein
MVEDKKDINKIRKGLTHRQIKYKKNRLLGMNKYNAARAAGYSHHTARKPKEALGEVDKNIQDELERAGATVPFLAGRLKYWAESYHPNGSMAAIREILELMGLKKQAAMIIDASQHNTQINNSVQVFDVKSYAEKLKELNGKSTVEITRLLSDSLGVPEAQAPGGDEG